jgi:hypothetical protein
MFGSDDMCVGTAAYLDDAAFVACRQATVRPQVQTQASSLERGVQQLDDLHSSSAERGQVSRLPAMHMQKTAPGQQPGLRCAAA